MSVWAVRVFALGILLGLVLTACDLPQPPASAATAAPTTQSIVTADPRATAAGLAMLRQGGSAVDAAIAAQAVLGLVEPQASGLLGGSELLIFSPTTREITVIDGMPTAPAGSPRSSTMTRSGTLLDPREVAFSPRATGVPGTLQALWAAHQQAGKLPWAQLFAPAIALARDGTGISSTLHALIATPGSATALGALARPYLAPDGTALPEGAIFTNPDQAAVLERVARLGPSGLTADGGLEEILDSLGRGAHPSLITAHDLTEYQPRIGHAICAGFDNHQICTAPPPAMGGVVMLQILGTAGAGDPDNPAYLHRFLEASRLAEADRRRYLADPDFAPVPLAGLLDSAYLAARATQIEPDRTLARPPPGEPALQTAFRPDPSAPQSATSALAIIDAEGQAVAMTSTINLHFGARSGALGMVFNNALLNFAPPPPTTLPGRTDRYANEMLPGKRPLSPIAPLIVLDAAGLPMLIGAGAGGAPIPDTMAMTLIRILHAGQSPEAALAAPHAHAADPDHIALELGTSAASLGPALEAMGHRVEIEPIDTGNVILLRDATGWHGAADPRRNGAAS